MVKGVWKSKHIIVHKQNLLKHHTMHTNVHTAQVLKRLDVVQVGSKNDANLINPYFDQNGT